MSSQGQKLIQAQMAAYQPQEFAFSEANLKTAKKIIAKYPKGKQQSALMPLLTLAQEQNANWLPVAAMDYVADMLEIPPMRAYEVATFYTMYHLAPVGRHVIEVCTTTPCWLRGSDDIVKTCKKTLGINMDETTADGEFTLKESECLAACVNAPVARIGEHYYEDLTPETMTQIIEDLRAGRTPKFGSQSGRHSCEPARGVTSLTEIALGVASGDSAPRKTTAASSAKSKTANPAAGKAKSTAKSTVKTTAKTTAKSAGVKAAKSTASAAKTQPKKK